MKGFKVSNDPMFEARVTEIVGFSLDPPERAVVLCLDEKSQIQALDRAVKKPRDIHLALDNYATHKTPEVRAWLEKHPRFKLHFTPTSASWMNLVERFFAEITARRIRRGSYCSVGDLEGAIHDYLLLHNAKPRPFVWSKTADDIITRERRALDALDEIRGNR